jgi:hypothetical protein
MNDMWADLCNELQSSKSENLYVYSDAGVHSNDICLYTIKCAKQNFSGFGF